MGGRTANIRKQIKNINKYYYDLYTYEVRNTNLTVPQVLVLRYLNGQPQMISSISENVRLSNSTISSIIDRLEKNGYVKRVRDPKDRRIVLVTETEKLSELRQKLPILQEDYFDFLWEDIDPDVVEQINHSLELLASHLQKKIKK